MKRSCESCGNPDDELLLVQRVYLDPSRPGEIDRIEVTPELWCLSCASQYPHQPVDSG